MTLLTEDMAAMTQGEVKFDDPTTWRKWIDSPKHGMLIQSFGIGHMPWLMYLRQRPSIQKVFSDFWKVPSEDMLCSTDGCAISFPPR
jgi:hypothetical protein